MSVIFTSTGAALSANGPLAIGSVTDQATTEYLRTLPPEGSQPGRFHRTFTPYLKAFVSAVVPGAGLAFKAADYIEAEAAARQAERTAYWQAQEANLAQRSQDMSLFNGGSGSIDWGNVITSLGNAYFQSRATAVSSPSMMVTPTMGALPPLGRALPALAGVGGLVVRGASTAMRSAQTYCRRNPAWCAQIGGTAAIMAMIESGQLPTIRRRRGRGITPRDLRSFKRVANLIRGFCPTVRRIPTRATRHVRGTGISHA